MTHGTVMEERAAHDVDLLPASSSAPQAKAVPQVLKPVLNSVGLGQAKTIMLSLGA